MLFNSVGFAIFLPVVFVLYWMAKDRLSLQNMLLLIASYFFYACWDWRLLFLLLFSTLLDFLTGKKIAETENKKKRLFWLWLSIMINVGLFGVFKYYNFFADSFASAVGHFGLRVYPWTLKVVLPVGISFYTFHGLSYIIDVYKKKVRPERNFTDYAVFVSFFPLLVAGPIERATHLLPQIKRSGGLTMTRLWMVSGRSYGGCIKKSLSPIVAQNMSMPFLIIPGIIPEALIYWLLYSSPFRFMGIFPGIPI